MPELFGYQKPARLAKAAITNGLASTAPDGTRAYSTTLKSEMVVRNGKWTHPLGQVKTQTSAGGGSVVVDADLGHITELTLTGNVTGWSIANGVEGQRLVIVFVQDGTGTRTLAGNAATVLLAGGAVTLTTTAGARDSIEFVKVGSNWLEVARSLALAQ